MNDKNLIQNKDRTPKELREIARKGGIASGRARRYMKTFRDVSMQILDEDSGRMVVAIVRAIVREALKGNISAAELLMRLCGELPGKGTKKNDSTNNIKNWLDKWIK